MSSYSGKSMCQTLGTLVKNLHKYVELPHNLTIGVQDSLPLSLKINK